MNLLPHIIFGSILFIILYMEPTYVFGIKFSHIWKIVALYFLALAFFMRVRWNRWSNLHSIISSCSSLKAGYMLCAWTALAGFFYQDPFSSVILAVQRLFPLLILQYILLRGLNLQQLIRMLVFVTIFVAASIVPFQLHLLEPLGLAYDVVMLLGAQKDGFVGVFQNQHVASLTLAMTALLSLMYVIDFPSLRGKKLFATALTGYLVFTLLLTYARAGFAALLLGGMTYAIISGRIYNAFRLVVFSAIGLVAVFLFFPELDVLKERILGRTSYSQQQKIDLSSASSGRTVYWKTAIDIFSEEPPQTWLTGIGEESLKIKMEQRVGMSIFAHNGLINELLVSGIIGLILFIWFLSALYRDIYSIQSIKIQNIGLSLFSTWIAFMFFQGGEFPLQLVILLLFVAIAIAERQQVIFIEKRGLNETFTHY